MQVRTVFFKSNKVTKYKRRKFITSYFKNHLTDDFMTFMVKNDLNLELKFSNNEGNLSRSDILVKYENWSLKIIN